MRAVTAVTSVSDKDVMKVRESDNEGAIVCCGSGLLHFCSHDKRAGRSVHSPPHNWGKCTPYIFFFCRPLAERGPMGSGWNGPSRMSR